MLAMAVRSAFDTAKGSLVRSIMFPKPHPYTFGRDACRFVGILAVFGMLLVLFVYLFCCFVVCLR